MKKIVYLAIISSMIGASIISIQVAAFQLSLFRTLIMLTFLIMVIEQLKTHRRILIKKPQNKFSLGFMTIWVVYGFLTVIWVKDFSAWIKAVFFLGLGLLCVIVITKYLKSRDDILIAFNLMTIMIMFHNVLGWYEVLTGNYLFLSGEKCNKYLTLGLPVSTFGNTNDLAVFLAASVFILYTCFINSSKYILKAIFISILLSTISLLLMTGSRGSIVGLLVSLTFLVFFSVRKRKTRRLLISIIIGLVFVVIISPNSVLAILSEINKTIVFNFQQQSGSDYIRKNLIRNGMSFLVSSMGIGTGAGNIEYWMLRYGKYNTGGVLNIHNWWMEILVGYGVLIFLLYITFYTKLFINMVKKFQMSDDKIDMSISLGIICVMSGYVVSSVSSSSNIDSEWLWVFWAISIAYQGIEVKNTVMKGKIVND